MSSTRRRSARPDPSRYRPASSLEALESRQLLTQSPYLAINAYPLTDYLPATNPGSVPLADVQHPIGSNPAVLATYQNQGKILTGQDRQGNRWQLTLKGPGQIIVTDTTPNDGVLDDDINTITLVGTSLTRSTLVGTVEQSARQPTTQELLTTLGQVYFNRLEATQGVKSIVLNGFVLTDTITPPGSQTLSPLESALNQTTGINLQGGVGLLEFGGIDGFFPTPNPLNIATTALPTTMSSDPIRVVIGSPTSPLKVHPNVRIDHIYNTVYDNTAFSTDSTTGLLNSGTIPTGPLTSPTVQLIVNGKIAGFDVVSISQEPNLANLTPNFNNAVLNIPTIYIPTASAALAYQYPVVGTTGRTSVQATAINHIKASASITNVTFSKAIQPFQNSLTGLDSVGYVQIGGQTDAVGIDSRGSIKLLRFVKGLGNPTGLSQNPIYYGTPTSAYGYAALGLEAVQVVTEGTIGQLIAGPNGQFLQISQDPAKIQSGLNQTTVYVNRPGQAVTESLVAAGGSIGKIHIVGDLTNSEIKAGYNYYGALAGSEGVSGSSSVGPVTLRGSLIDSVISASYRPNDGIYGNGNDTAGNGVITGSQAGVNYKTTTGKTVLGNQGSGFFARSYGVAVHPAKKVRK